MAQQLPTHPSASNPGSFRDEIVSILNMNGLTLGSEPSASPGAAPNEAPARQVPSNLPGHGQNPAPLYPFSDVFWTLCTRAYQEAVKFPDRPPPAVWAPGDALNDYYEAHIYKFFDVFRSTLERNGNDLPTIDPHAFRSEWLIHARSIMDNIRLEWDVHPIGSMGGWKTTASTANSSAAAFALGRVIEKATVPPPAGFEVLIRERRANVDDLHMYYRIMLNRFETHLERYIAEHSATLQMTQGQISEAVVEFVALLIEANRVTWLELFGRI